MAGEPSSQPIEEPDGLDRALHEIFRTGSASSVLGRLDSEGKLVSRIWLREEDSDPGQVVKPKPPDAPGGAIDRYQVVGEIARGGVGVVLKGRDVDLGRDVALKMLREEHAENPEVLQRFVEEAQIGGQLQHPGIVPVYDLGLGRDRRPYFTMKLVKGRTLAALLAERSEPSVDRRRFLQIFEATCQTVAYAHARGVIHRDLKPANVMVGAFGEVLVVDWGMGKVLTRGGVADERKSRVSQAPEQTVIETVRSEGTGSNSVVGSVMGTLRYMPPEQATGDVERMDERSDVFSLGAILCEILTGQPPYVGEALEALEQARRGRLEGAHERLDVCGADGDLVELVKVCLAPAPAARPKDAAAVAAEIAAHLASLDEKARQAQLDAEAARVKALEERRRRRLSVLLAASVVGIVLLGAGGWTWRQAELRQRSDEIARRVDAAVGEVTRLRGLAAAAAPEEAVVLWGEALGAARQALAVAEAPDGETGPRERAQALVEDLEAEQARAQERAAAAERDEAMVRRLEEIHGEFADSWDEPTTRRAYAAAFREHLGVDLASAPVEAAADLLTGSAIREELALALEEWISYGGAEAPRLASVLERADPDPWRARLRRAAGDREALARLMDAADLETLPVESLLRLALGFHGVRDAVRMRQVALTAWRRAPGDFWACLHCFLAHAELVPPDPAGAVRFATAAVAARPRSAAGRSNLGVALLVMNRLDDALRELREAVRLQPNGAIARCNLSLVLSRMRRYDEALAEARAAVRLRPEVAEAHLKLAVALGGKRLWAEAIAASREAIRFRPDLAAGHANLAGSLSGKGLHEEAVEACREAIRLDPGCAQAHCNLGKALGELGRYEEAVSACREAIRLDPWLSAAHCNLGVALRKLDRLEEAIAACRRGLEVDPASVQARVNLGNALCEVGRHEEALALLREAVRLAPDHAGARCGLGMACGRVGELDEALAETREAIRLDPTLAAAHGNLCWVLVLFRRYDEAIAAGREAIRLDPELVHARLNLANALQGTGFHELSVAQCRELLRRRPDFAFAHNSLGIALRSLGRTDEAEAAYREAIRLDPGFANPHSCLGNLLLEDRGLVDDAIAEHREAVRLAPERGDLRSNLGNSLRRKGLLDEAVAACREAVRRSPGFAPGHAALGRRLAEKGETDEAIAAYRDAIRIDSTLALARYNMGVVLDRARRIEEAIEAYRGEIRINPGFVWAHVNLAIDLTQSGRPDEAIEVGRRAVDVDPDRAECHLALARALDARGLCGEALEAFRRAQELGSRQPGLSALFAALVRQAERMAELERRLPAVLDGREEAGSPADALALGEIAYKKRLFAGSARLRAEGLAGLPGVAGDLRSVQRYNAACAAALAGAGKGEDAGTLDEAGRARWRRQAIAWLRADLERWSERDAADAEPARRMLEHWKKDPDLAGIRDEAEVAKLPPVEQEACRALWGDVGALLERAGGKR